MVVWFKAFSKKGINRDKNKDALLIGEKIIQEDFFTDEGKLNEKEVRFAVADGVSSQRESNLVSKFILVQLASLKEISEEKIKWINNITKEKYPDLFSTLSILEIKDKDIRIFNVGNSAVYRKFEDKMIRLTKLFLVDGKLTNAIGMSEIIIQSISLPYKEGDEYLIVSDGVELEENFSFEEILNKKNIDDSTLIFLTLGGKNGEKHRLDR